MKSNIVSVKFGVYFGPILGLFWAYFGLNVVNAAAHGRLRPIVIEDCNDDPAWDRGSVGVRGYSKNGCHVSGGGFYRVS